MSLESVFKLSLIMNMIDNLSGPMAGVASKVGANVSKLDAASQTFGSMAKAGAAMQETGSQIVNAVLAPVEATFETRRALGELASLGVQDLEAVENAARSFSDQWAGTSKADFISASHRESSSQNRPTIGGVIWALQCTPGVSANRWLWISRARTTRARISADFSPDAIDCSSMNGTGSISTWRSMRSSSGPEIRLR